MPEARHMACSSADIDTAARLLLEIVFQFPEIDVDGLPPLASVIAADLAYIKKLQARAVIEPYKIATARTKRDMVNAQLRALHPLATFPALVYPVADPDHETPEVFALTPEHVAYNAVPPLPPKRRGRPPKNPDNVR